MKEKYSFLTFVSVFILLAAGFVIAGYFYYVNYKRHFRIQAEHELSAIANLKAGEITQWRNERLGGAYVFYKNVNFTGLVRRFLENPGDRDARERIGIWMTKVREAYNYDRICLHDATGVERLSVPEQQEPTVKVFSRNASEVLATKKVAFQDFYRSDYDKRVYLTVMTPILDEKKGDEAIAVLALRIDPERYLYPLINRWPTPSRTGESLILRREGDDALFLNELRFQKNTALNLRTPLAQTEMTAVKAVLGQKGVAEGIDYRGQPVVADMRPIPGSPWFLVARMDIAEIYAPLREKLWAMIALVCALLIGAGAVIGFLWRRQGMFYYQERLQATEAFRVSDDKLRKALKMTIVELERSNKELEQFAYVASHDLQEPLRMISSYTQLLAERYKDKIDEKAQKYINYAVDGATRMQRLINDLLAYSRVGTRGKPLEPADAHSVLGEAIKNLASAIEESHAVVTNGDLPTVYADASQLVIVFQNLVSNAIKFHGNEPPCVHVCAEEKEDEWLLSVKDNGIGIDPQYRDKLFVIFQRLHTRQEYPGTGIGLAVCKRIIERHGGKIWFESEPGKGSTFYFTVPKQERS